MTIVRYGVVGLGSQGTTYVTKIFDQGKAGDAVVTALCDINPDKIKNIQEKTTSKNIAYFTDYKQMLDSGLVDVVLIQSPHYSHPEIAIECFKRGIHVICDKPAGVYTKQVREMNEAAVASGALFGMMFNQRTNCLYRKMRELIAAGELGQIQRVTWIITDWYRTQSYFNGGSWRATWDGEGGGVLINQSPHQLDLVSWVVGMMPKTVNGFCKYGMWHDIEVEDDVTAYFEYENGATGVFITTTGEAPGTNRFEVSGTGGKLLCEGGKLVFYKNKVDSLENSKTSELGFRKPECEIVEVETDGLNEQHAGIIRNFTNTLLGKEQLFVDGKEGINGVELMNAIELSGWYGGKRITLPVDEEEYLRELNIRRKNSRTKATAEDKIVDTTGTY